jgi:hypothetical protein
MRGRHAPLARKRRQRCFLCDAEIQLELLGSLSEAHSQGCTIVDVGTKRYQQPGGTPTAVGNQNWTPPTAARPATTAAFILEAPASPDVAWDLVAAAMLDPSLEANGWTAKLNGAPYTVLLRAGDVQLTGSPANGTYWSTLLSGRLVLKFPAGSTVEVFRASAGSYVYKSHVSPSNWDASLIQMAFVAQGNNFDQAGNSIVYAGRVSDSAVQGVLHVGPASFTIAYNSADAVSELNVDRVAYITDTGSGARGLDTSFRYPNGVYWRASLSLINATFTTSSAGVLLKSTNASGPNFFYLDFIRRLPPGSIL